MKTESQNKRILEHLKKGNGITALTAFKWFNITNLKARIHELRKSVDVYDIWQGVGQRKYKVYYTKESFLYEKHKAPESMNAD